MLEKFGRLGNLLHYLNLKVYLKSFVASDLCTAHKVKFSFGDFSKYD